MHYFKWINYDLYVYITYKLDIRIQFHFFRKFCSYLNSRKDLVDALVWNILSLLKVNVDSALLIPSLNARLICRCFLSRWICEVRLECIYVCLPRSQILCKAIKRQIFILVWKEDPPFIQVLKERLFQW